MSEQTKAIVRRLIDGFKEGRAAALAILDEVVTPDYVMHDPSGEVSGKEAIREFIGSLFDGLPDIWMTLEEAVAEGDRVAYRFTLGGTHKGELMGFPPTGKQVQASVTSVARFADEKMAEEWQTWDFHGFLQQLSSTEANKVLARRLFEEVFNQRDFTAAEEICSGDILIRAWHWPELRGISGVREFVAGMASGSPDFQYSIDDLIAEGDQVDLRWTFKGTHLGAFLGIAATGKIVTVAGATTLRMAGGKIVEHSGRWDALGCLQQFSATEAPTVQVPVQVKAESAG